MERTNPPETDTEEAGIVSYAEAVASNVTRARAGRHISQEQVAQAMRDLGYAWVRQTVTEAEKNRRRITVEELLGLSIVLRTELTMLMFPSPDDAPYGTVTLPNSQPVSLANAFPLSSVRFRPPGGWPGERGREEEL